MSAERELVKTRIRNAFLSEKNTDSVFEQIMCDAEAKCGPIGQAYTEVTLRDFQCSMMRYLWAIGHPRLQTEHLMNPKNTVFLLNALTLRRVVKAIHTQLQERRPPVGLIPFPTPVAQAGLTTARKSPEVDAGGSVPIDYLHPRKRRTVRISKLGVSAPLHDWWSKPEKRNKLEAKYATELGYNMQPTRLVTPDTTDTPMVGVDSEPEPPEHLPWKYVQVSSVDRSSGSPDAYIVSGVELSRVQRLSLHKVDIPIKIPILPSASRFFYFAEDDEPMHIIDLNEEQEGINASIVTVLQETMNRMGRHSYSVTLNKFTRRISIVQRKGEGFELTAPTRLSLLFEQTQDNCCEILGFERMNYRGDVSYESSMACSTLITIVPGMDRSNQNALQLSLRIPQLSDSPILQLALSPGTETRKQHQFDDHVIEQLTDGRDFRDLSVAFTVDEDAPYSPEGLVGEHTFVFKCWYLPHVSPTAQTAQTPDENGSHDDVNPRASANDTKPEAVELTPNPIVAAVKASATQPIKRKKLPPLNLGL